MKHANRSRCGARTRDGTPCERPPLAGRTRCRLHGGATPTGIASPHFKHGRYSRDLPTRLAALYADAATDQELLALRDELGLVTARIGELLSQLQHGESAAHWQALQESWRTVQHARRAGDTGALAVALSEHEALLDGGAHAGDAWTDILRWIEVRRKLALAEHKRLVAMQQMITAQEAMTLIAALTDAIRKHVHDREALAAIASEFQRLMHLREDA